MAIRAVLLDAGNTLFTERSSRAAVYQAALERHGVVADEASVGRAMAETHQELPVELDGAFRYSEAWFVEFIARVFGRLTDGAVPASLAPQLFTAFEQAETFRLFDDVLPLLNELRGTVQLAVVSNGSPALPTVLQNLGLADFFDGVTVSAVERVEKPHPEIFHRTLTRLQVPPQDAFHIGDHWQNDVEGARSSGLGGVHLDRVGSDQSPGGIRSLREIPALLASH